MEQKITALAKLIRPIDEAVVSAPIQIANRVYSLRKRSLVPPLAILPALLGAALLTGGMGFVASGAGRPSAIAKTAVESVSPETIETIWKKQVIPRAGKEFHLTLDLGNTLRAIDARSGKFSTAGGSTPRRSIGHNRLHNPSGSAGARRSGLFES